MTSRDGRCGRASSGFPATMIRRSACHRQSHEAPVIEFNYRGSGCPCSLPCGCGGLRGGPPQSTLLPLGNKKDDQWPGQLRPSLRSASASRSTGICRLSSDPAAFARSCSLLRCDRRRSGRGSGAAFYIAGIIKRCAGEVACGDFIDDLAKPMRCCVRKSCGRQLLRGLADKTLGIVLKTS
jgi:hypothetical protein